MISIKSLKTEKKYLILVHFKEFEQRYIEYLSIQFVAYTLYEYALRFRRGIRTNFQSFQIISRFKINQYLAKQAFLIQSRPWVAPEGHSWNLIKLTSVPSSSKSRGSQIACTFCISDKLCNLGSTHILIIHDKGQPII